MHLIVRLTSVGFHQWINRKRGWNLTDSFPTRYRCNTPAEAQAIARKASLIVDGIALAEGRPGHLHISALTYIVGLGYERPVNATDLLAQFRILMISTLSKSACS